MDTITKLFFERVDEEIAEATKELRDPDCKGHLSSLASGYLEGLEKARDLMDELTK